MPSLFKCTRCGEMFREPLITCPVCGGLVRSLYDWQWGFTGETGIWDYSPMLPPLPVHASLGEAHTPLIRSWNLFRERVYFKDEGRNPTGSFRDRAASIVVSHAASNNVKRIILASDGNMGVSVSAYAARMGISVSVLLPSTTDPEKIMLMRAFGAQVALSEKGIDELVEEAEKKARETGYYNATSTLNTLSIDGLKTISYEIYRDMGVPSEIYIPVGSGLTYLSIFEGFRELYSHGIINRIPVLIGVESCGNPVYYEQLYGRRECVEKPLPGLSYMHPRVMGFVIDVLERYGRILLVRKRRVLAAAKKLSRCEGLFVEPSSAVALAGALESEPKDNSVIILTGHGLKGSGAFTVGSRLREPSIFPESTKKSILKILAESGELTGYMVWKKLGLRITPQAVYQHLRDLAGMGFVDVRVRRGRKLYRLTEKGRRVIE